MTKEISPPFSQSDRIRELEVSLTHRCTLACTECGFLVPDQPRPHAEDGAVPIVQALEKLASLGVTIGRLVLVGGEPTLAKVNLRDVCTWADRSHSVESIEVVSNGLSPDHVDVELLESIQRLVISDYVPDSGLAELWVRWVGRVAPNTEVQIRRHEHWDKWTGPESVDQEAALRLWRTCWYRKHCVTIERGRIFSCSRIPKLGRDEEGLLLSEISDIEQLRAWLNADRALPSCTTCVPMISPQKVPVGEQPDNRFSRLVPRAKRILTEKIDAS